MPTGGACIQDEQQLEQSRFHKKQQQVWEFQTDNYNQLYQHNAHNPTACQGTTDLFYKKQHVLSGQVYKDCYG